MYADDHLDHRSYLNSRFLLFWWTPVYFSMWDLSKTHLSKCYMCMNRE